MTAPVPGPHLDLDALADVEEDLVAPEQASAARAHLDECADCRERLAQLRTSRALLTALPQDPMPADVVARTEAALAAAAADGTAGTVLAMNRRGRFWNTPAMGGIAAAVAVLVLIGAVVVGNISSHHHHPSTSAAGSNSGAAAAPATGVADIKEWSSNTNYTLQNIPVRVPPLVLGTPPTTTSFGTDAPGAPAPSANTSSGNTGSGSALSGSSRSGAQSAAAGYTLAQLRTSRAALVDCGRILADGVATTPLAVDFARFEGKPAAVIVLPSGDQPNTHLDVWVVRTTCSSASPDLVIRRIARPPGS